MKASNKAVRCFIYHNVELALEWMESQRQVMYDPRNADWFIQYTDGMGHKNGTIYNANISWGDQYFWDFRNQEAADYYISSVLASIAVPEVDGTFTDDVGFGGEHPEMLKAINISAGEADAINNATLLVYSKLIDELVVAGKYNWQSLSPAGERRPQPLRKLVN